MDNIINQQVNQVVNSFLQDFSGVGLGLSLINGQGTTIFQDFYGVQDMESQQKINEDTLFGIASISKSFTALSIMQLVEQKKLALSDTVASFIPELNQDLPITLEHLLTHSSGFTPLKRQVMDDFTSEFESEDKTIEPATNRAFLDMARQEVARKINTVGLTLRPGEYASYCNDGYALLSEVICSVSKESSLEDYLQKYVFMPLQMTNSSCKHNIKGADFGDNISTLYSKEGEKITGNQDFRKNLMILPGGGSVKSTVGDMKKYVQFFLNLDTHEEVLSAFYRKEMMKPRMAFGYQTYYGYGLNSSFLDDLTVVGHGGSLPGVSSHVLWSPESDMGVIILCNTNNVPVRLLANYILSAFHENNGNIPLMRDNFKINQWSADIIHAFSGEYESLEGVQLEIIPDEKDVNSVYLQTSDKTSPIIMVSPTAGICRGEYGEYTYFQLAQSLSFKGIFLWGTYDS